MPRNVPQASYTCIAPNEDPEKDQPLCGKASRGLSLCSTHLRRWQRRGTLERARAPQKPPQYADDHPECSIDGCDKPEFAKGWCGMHYSRVYNGGELGPAETIRVVVFTEDGTCIHEEGCPRPVHRDGWCSMHWRRVARNGHPGPLGPIKDRPHKWGNTEYRRDADRVPA